MHIWREMKEGSCRRPHLWLQMPLGLALPLSSCGLDIPLLRFRDVLDSASFRQDPLLA